MRSLISKFIAPFELEILAGVILLVVCFCMWEVHHQRQIGAAQVVAGEAKARAEEHVKNVAREAALQKKADDAEADRNEIAKTLAQYAATHPVGSVRLCKPARHPTVGMSTPGHENGGPNGSGPGPDTVPEVLGGGEGVDIGPDVDAILRAAETLGGLYRSTQRGS